jgi:ubiquinone/menaquinone biosynthesis C-methylase UbiE
VDKMHWEKVYQTRQADQVSWFQEHAERSLQFIRNTGVAKDARIMDVGGGASTLVDDLLRDGYLNLTVLDISAAALQAAQVRLGNDASRVHWLEADITQIEFPEASVDVWHDRAVFHFLTNPQDRQRYVRAVLRAVKPGGHVIRDLCGRRPLVLQRPRHCALPPRHLLALHSNWSTAATKCTTPPPEWIRNSFTVIAAGKLVF